MQMFPHFHLTSLLAAIIPISTHVDGTLDQTYLVKNHRSDFVHSVEDLIGTGYNSFDLCHSILEFHSVQHLMIIDLVFNFLPLQTNKNLEECS